MSEDSLALRTGVLKLDTLRIAGDRVSLEGIFFVAGDTLCFADKVITSVMFYDTTGHYIGSALSKGRGPNEVTGIENITKSASGGHIILNTNWMVYEIDATWNITKQGRLNWTSYSKIDTNNNISHPNPNNTSIYELEYPTISFRMYDEKYLFFVICTDHINFNGFEANAHAKEYYREAYNIGIFSRDSLRLLRMFGNYPPLYERYRYLSLFKEALLEVCRHQLVFSFQIDSLLYVMDLRDSCIQSFGHAGIGMNTDYPEYRSLQEYDKHYNDRDKYGYYRYLYYEPCRDFLFRGYCKGGESQGDGLQVYKDFQYIGNYDVPCHFKVIGYIAPYFYASGKIDYDTEEMIVYRFKLPGDE